jgi:hypothetical protein
MVPSERLQAPFHPNSRRDETDDSGIEAIDRDNKEAKEQEHFLQHR